MKAALARIIRAIRLWWVNPAPTPEELGEGGSHKKRPVPIELAFYLHADGTVYHRQRSGDGVRRVRDETTVALVHREYRILAERARRHARLQRMRMALRQALRKRALDPTESESVS